MRFRIGCIVLLAAAALAGCGDDGLRPSARSGSYVGAPPMQVGNRWGYAHVFTAEWKDMRGFDVLTPVRIVGSGVREITGVESIDGRYYVVESQTVTADGQLTFRWRRLRQDATTLYRADVNVSIPPGEVDVNPLGVGEQRRLQLPVSIGDSWQLRPGVPAIVLTVEAFDTLELATGVTTAYRVNVKRVGASETNFEYEWYNAGGLVRRRQHVEVVAVDALTGDMVRIITDEVEELTSIELVGAD